MGRLLITQKCYRVENTERSFTSSLASSEYAFLDVNVSEVMVSLFTSEISSSSSSSSSSSFSSPLSSSEEPEPESDSEPDDDDEDELKIQTRKSKWQKF